MPCAGICRGALVLLGVALLGGCSGQSPGSGQVCTALFAYVTTTVVDSTGQPVNDLAIRDSVLRTGHAFDVANQSLALTTPGSYVILSDNDLDSVRATGDSVRVSGSSVNAGPAPSPGFSVTYVLGSDGCHVKKLAGPDTVVAR